jgi:phosphodiesterase/alkaline phosphatase D-like protein
VCQLSVWLFQCVWQHCSQGRFYCPPNTLFILLLRSAFQDSVDYVVHLGDYIYEYKNGYYGWGDALGRIPLPNKEIFSLYDYRKRLATYRTDLDLIASHQQFPWIGTKPTIKS